MNADNGISSHRIKALNYISDVFDLYGHFPIYEHYPHKSNDWIYTHPSPFIHANVMYSLLNSGNIVSERLLLDASKFLWGFREPGDIWRFWKNCQSTNPVLCGTEDTAISSIVLEKLGYKLKNKKIIFNRVRHDGAIFTWFLADKKLLMTNIVAFLALCYNDRPSRETIRKKYMRIDDCEPTITATVVAYLGENEKTEITLNYLISSWKNWGINYSGNLDYYDKKIVFVFHLARAFKEGCLKLEKLKDDILDFIEMEIENFEFAELLIAYLSLSYFKLNHYLLINLKHKIIYQIENGSPYFDNYKYISSNDRQYYGGSNVLTASWFLEVTNDW